MAVDRKVIDIPLTGLDEKTQPELVDPGQGMVQLQNLVHTRSGALAKTRGLANLTTTTSVGQTLGGALALKSMRDELVLIDQMATSGQSSRIYSYSSVGPRWARLDRVPEPVVDRTPFLAGGSYSTTFTTPTDIVYVNGFLITICLGSGQRVTTAIDVTTGAIVYRGTVTMSASVRVTSVGNTVVAVYYDTGTTAKFKTLNATSAASVASGWSAASTLFTNCSASALLDVLSGAAAFYVVYKNSSGGANAVTLSSYDTSGAQQATTTYAVATPTGVALGGAETTQIWVAYTTAATTTVLGVSSALATTVTSANIFTGGAAFGSLLSIAANATTGSVVGCDGTTITYGHFAPSAGAVALGASSSCPRIVPVGQAFLGPQNRVYVTVRTYTNSTPSADGLFLIDAYGDDAPRPVATVAPRLLSTSASLLPTLPIHTATITAGSKFVTMQAVKRSALTTAIELITFDFSDTAAYSFSEWSNLGATGPLPSYYDRTRLAECGFLTTPRILSKTTSGTVAINDVNYVLVYEYADAAGNRHQSAPSVPFNVTGGPFDSVTLTVETCHLTNRQDSATDIETIQLVLYRTKANGSTYYRTSAIAANDPTVTTVAMPADILTDTLLGANEILYTQPGTASTACPRVAPPSTIQMVSFGDRLVSVGDDRVSLWFSGQAVIGEGPWFADVMQFPIVEGGKTTAIGTMDGRLVVFKERRVFVVDGTGFVDNASSNDLVYRSVSSDVGCIDRNSIVTTSAGMFFRSRRGIELLTRGFEVAPYFGRAVDQTVAGLTYCSGATVDETLGLVYFGLYSSGSGRVLIYDLVHGTWSIRVPLNASGNLYGVRGVTMYRNQPNNPTLAIADDAGTVYTASTSTYLDAGTQWQTSALTTGWIKVAGLQGYESVKRVMLLLRAGTRHDLTVSLYYDYASSTTDTRTYTDTVLNSLITGSRRIQLDIQPAQTKCSAIQIYVADATPSSGTITTGQGSTILGVALEVGLKQGRAKVPAAGRS